MAVDAHKNFAISSVVTPPAPATTGTTFTIGAGEGVRMPATPFNATVCSPAVMPTPATAEIVRVTARTGDVLTITRAQEGTTARAIVVGDLIAAAVTAKSLQDIETTYAAKDAGNTFTQDQTLSGAFRLLTFNHEPAPVDQRKFRLYSSGAGFSIEAINDAGTVTPGALVVSRTGNATLTGDLYEKNRTAPLGHWIPVPYNASHYTADVGAWTVEAADVITNSYTLIGKTLLWLLFINAATVAGSPTYLRITIPPPYQLASGIMGLVGNSTDGIVFMENLTATIVSFRRSAGGAFTNLTNGHNIGGCFTLAIL